MKQKVKVLQRERFIIGGIKNNFEKIFIKIPKFWNLYKKIL